jgi:biopolymer transport protein ExbD
MTAMCDVAFLLLSFFIMTATSKVPEPKPVDTPASTIKAKLPERNLMTITIGDSAVYIGMSDRETRVAALEAMSLKYDIAFTPQEINEFSLLDSFGVPLEQLKSLLALKNQEHNQVFLTKEIFLKMSYHTGFIMLMLQLLLLNKQKENKELRKLSLL